MDCTNKNCPAYAKCLSPYRGSRCKATRATYGLGDPMTNADRIRSMTDEDLAEWLAKHNERSAVCPNFGAHDCQASCRKCWLDWLKQEAGNERPTD
jgi:hypothetical protein